MTREQLDSLIAIAADFGIRLVVALLVLLVGHWLAKLARRMARRAMERAKVDATLVGFLSNILFYALMVTVVIAAAGQLGIATTSFVAMLGAAGLAVGLALQGSLSNFASGVLLILFRPFKVGDFVEAGGVMGSVDEIGILHTRMHSPDNRGLTIPNSQIMGSHIVNFNAFPTRRMDLTFGIGYDDDIDAAKAILSELLASDERWLKDPEPTVAVTALGDSSVNIVMRGWVAGSDYWALQFDMLETVKKRFDAAGISIPFPQRDVHLYTVAAEPPPARD